MLFVYFILTSKPTIVVYIKVYRTGKKMNIYLLTQISQSRHKYKSTQIRFFTVYKYHFSSLTEGTDKITDETLKNKVGFRTRQSVNQSHILSFVP
jgi:glycerol kinase